MWNLENEQFAELIINPTLTYYHRYFERAPVQTDRGLGWRNIWRRLQEDDAACLHYYECHCRVSAHCVIHYKQAMVYNQH
ncbi:unnamed protein product [Brassica napus]|uniref:(rape) hypothetical protein n=1 Tax=Brassica napus TaxID=3708 RepID=A0A816SM91_BRANA|nr:unnamed protein product [Brassica napus]